MSVLGIDVSHYNDQVDWAAVAGSEVKFAFVKATEGSSTVSAPAVAAGPTSARGGRPHRGDAG